MHPKLALAWLAISGLGLAAPNGHEHISIHSCPKSDGIHAATGVATTVTAAEEALYSATEVADGSDDGTTTVVSTVNANAGVPSAKENGRPVRDDSTTDTHAVNRAIPKGRSDLYDCASLDDGYTGTPNRGGPVSCGAKYEGNDGSRMPDAAGKTAPTPFPEGSALGGAPFGSHGDDTGEPWILAAKDAPSDRATASASRESSAGGVAESESDGYLYAPTNSEAATLPEGPSMGTTDGDSSLDPGDTRTPTGGPEHSSYTEPESSGDGARPDGFYGTETTVPGYSPGPHGRNTSTGGSSPTSNRDCSDPPTAFQLNDRPYENFFYTDCNVAAQVVVTNPGPEDNLTIIGPRLVVAWPAGNSGAAAFFAPDNGINGTLAVAVDNQTSEGAALYPVHLPPPAGSDYPSVGVSGTLVFNDTAVLTLAILGSETF